MVLVRIAHGHNKALDSMADTTGYALSTCHVSAERYVAKYPANRGVFLTRIPVKTLKDRYGDWALITGEPDI